MKNNFLSKAYGGVMEARHKLNGLGLPRQWKVITSTLLLLFTFAIGNVWAAAHSITPNKTGTNYEIYEIAHANNQSGTVIKTKTNTFNDDFAGWCSGAIYDYSGSVPTVPSGISANWLTQSTKGAKIRSTGITFEVTNCVGVTVLGKAAGTSGAAKKLTLSVKSGGDEVGAIASDWNTNVHELTYGSTLTASTTYTVTVASSGEQNCEFYQIRFEAPASGPSVSSFSPATGATVKSGTSITITGSTGSTIYYKWATSTQTADDIYNSGSGSHGTADAASATTTVESGKTLYAIARKGTTNSAVASASYTIDDDGPELVSSIPVNSATDVAVEGTIVLTFDEDVAAIDDSKFSLSGATIGAVAIDGTDATKVNVPYSGAANSATVTLSVQAEAVEDALENKSAALSDIAFTTVAAETPTCPSGLTISGTTTYTEGQTISLTAALSAGNGSITYNWYKGADLATAKAAGSIGTGTSYSKASCVTGDAGSYWCEATKDECSPASNAEAYAVTVNTLPTSSSINIEQWVLDNGAGKGNGKVTEQTATLLAALTTANIAYTNANELDSLTTASGRNEPYLGLKFKSVSSTITIIVPAEQTLKVKFGERKTAVQVAINDGAASAATITDGIYSLAATSAVRQVKFSVTQDNKTIVLKQVMVGEDIKTVTLPWLVTYDAGEHGTCATAKQTWTGTALTLPDVTPESGWDFNGWNDGTADHAAGDTYTPTTNVTMTAQYTAQASPYDLTSLTYKIGEGAATNVGYTDGTYTYNIVLPYKASYDAITVTPTLKVGTSYLKGDEVLTVSSLPGAATFTVVEAGGASEQLYTINFSKAAKDGVCLVWGDITADNTITYNATNSKFYAESDVTLDTDVNGKDSGAPSGKKFQGGDHIQIGLNEGTFLEGDVVALNVTYGTAHVMHVFKAQAATSSDVIGEAAGNTDAGLNKVAITEDAATLWLVRGGDYADWNPHVDYVAVYRIMNPVLTAISFDGVDADKDSEFAFSATLPQGTNLGTMTITPAIVWNGAGTSAPTAAWAWGANTFRVTDKDGDYTDYTITLTEALAPSAAPTITTQPADGNYYECATISALEVVATGSGTLTYQWYLGSDEIDGATDATYTPTVTAIGTYVYHCVVTNTEAGHPATSLASDNATITISEDPAAIKLIVDGATPGTKKINDEAYYTGSPLTSVSISEVETPCVKLNGGAAAATAPYSADKNDNRVIAYCAQTTQTKIRVIAYSDTNNSRSYTISFVEEGQTADEADDNNVIVNLPTDKTIHTSDWYTFNSSNNRTIYITIPGNNSDYHFLQVKVIESGTPIKKAGDLGYSMNFNVGRPIGVKQTLHKNFEGFDFYANNDYKVLKSTSMVISNATNDYIKFHAAAPMTLAVTTENSASFYVTKAAKGTDNETLSTAGGISYIDLDEAADWYISPKGGDVKIQKIEFIAPKCQQPTVADMENIGLCEGDAFTALTVSASVTDGGTLHYQWYKHPAAGDDEAVGTDAASYTPEADGQYYVVVTNQLADHSDNSKTSNTVTVEHFASAVITTAPLNQRATVGNSVTLSVAATGKNVAYKWYTCDEDGSNEVALDPEQTGTSIDVTVTAGLLQWYKVKVTSDCGNAEAKAKVEEFVPATPANVTESIVWDWKSTTAGFPTENTSIDFANTSVEQLFADVDAAMPNNAEFRSDMLYGIGQRAWRKSDNDGECGFQGFQIRFHSDVAGLVRVYFRAPSSGQTSVVTIDGKPAGSRGNSWGWSEYVEVPAAPTGDGIVIAMTNGATGMTRVQKIEFLALAHRRTAAYSVGELGTICLEDDAKAVGANVYELQGHDENGKMVFDQILSGEIEAGKPYLFQATNASQVSFYKKVNATHADDAGSLKGMYGTFVDKDLYPATDVDMFYFSGTHIWAVKDFQVASITIPAHRCYVNYAEFMENPVSSPTPLPGRKRLMIGVNGAPAVATGLENVQGDNVQCTKVLINGQLFILRGEKMYDAKGQLVK